ncbi:hypothetical protein EVAR_36438_1 [Eumeta japonica]|uniref:Uncharacterized protein n=1 Tax=Eumeta variegata TaxID=151549 RepID=A0A4C1VQN7_EUMVA|nr:hypothetical protein EVAR_36438_1 [Eumeta japonica]
MVSDTSPAAIKFQIAIIKPLNQRGDYGTFPFNEIYYKWNIPVGIHKPIRDRPNPNFICTRNLITLRTRSRRIRFALGRLLADWGLRRPVRIKQHRFPVIGPAYDAQETVFLVRWAVHEAAPRPPPGRDTVAASVRPSLCNVEDGYGDNRRGVLPVK